ncbi:tetratricopeptide repeat-containing diguanylate cyclase [Deinococcus cellulosilyticus]|uniref:GGDEF domain-containing protein n=1 Tax=Deinococcus cellulosilyticus (strain DSM 18568 / NBRC 106333 / KACC 11606 / 5516J-15) TaxID=1223518 RepID=A0A511N5H6_DEIC1|nr:diguanylate cyclase [Deinococcus cellulosilyticus]GEM47661.1 hypothetical protein DC3_32960 [Deinococcus cellulosilyticus NBRC 106333 = KACC 11606]
MSEPLPELYMRLQTVVVPEDWIACALEITSQELQLGQSNPRAIQLARDVITEIRDNGRPEDLPEAINNLATLLFQSNQMYEALETLDAHQQELSQASVAEQRRTLNLKGGIHQMLGDLTAAYAFYEAALQMTRRSQDGVFRGKLLNNMSLLLQQQHRYPQALELLQEAEKLHQEQQNSTELCRVWINQAELLFSEAQLKSGPETAQTLQQATDKLEQTQFLLKVHPNPLLQCLVHDLLARVLLKQGLLDEAQHHALQAIQDTVDLQSEDTLFHSELTLGEIELARNCPLKALAHFQTARQGFEGLGFKENVLEVLEWTVRTLRQLERYQEALEHMEEMFLLDREIRSEEANRQLEVMAYQRKMERMQHEAELERIRSAELEQLVMERMEEVQALLEKKRHLEEANLRMRELSEKDGLTGVYNRRYLNENCEKVFASMRQQDQEFSVLIMDIDNFKSINDRFSHQIGDVVLKTLASLLQQALRTSDTIARYGGEEFVVVMPHTGIHNAKMVAERIRTTVANHPWSQVYEDLKVTLSLGVANNLNVDSAEHMIHVADEALYHSKRTGKNRVTVSPLSEADWEPQQ